MGEDELVWKVEGAKGRFSVSSFYWSLVGVVGRGFQWKSIWVPGVLSKVAFFMWTAAFSRNLTLDNLMRHGHILVNRCCTCCEDAETVDHLFLHCCVACRLWGSLCSLFGICLGLTSRGEGHVVELAWGSGWLSKAACLGFGAFVLDVVGTE